MTLEFEKLNERQKEAVKHRDGPCLVIAGAGSGKTRVITCRIAHLIRKKGIHPYNILAVTFTNKAADEMLNRVMAKLGHKGPKPLISTFHSLGLRILRKEHEHIDRSSSFLVYDEGDQKRILKNCMNTLELSTENFNLSTLAGKINSLKDNLVSPGEFRNRASGFYEEKVSRIYTSYQKILKRNDAFDFADLIRRTVKLFEEKDDVLEEWAERFRFIMVDEYQDTNHSQYELINQLSSVWKNLFVVGDEDQSIYRWRGADITNILGFEKDFPEAKTIKLEENYRSTGVILEGANSVISKNEQRLGKKLWTRRKDGEKIRILSLSTDVEEAKEVVNRIEKLRGKYDYSDIAVFYRTNAQSRSFEDVFVERNIPYQIIGGTRFYNRMEIKDIIAYLRLTANPEDDTSLRRIINVPKRRIGEKTLQRLENKAEETNSGLTETLEISREESGAGWDALENFYSLMLDIRRYSSHSSIPDLIKYIIEETGYKNYLEKKWEDSAEQRIENLDELVSAATDYSEREEEPELRDFLDGVTLVSSADEIDRESGINLMTLHCAKGLEFPVVFMTGMEENIFPHSRSSDDSGAMEEERRLCYVGMTRAEDRLYMSYAERRRMYGDYVWNDPSPYIKDIPEKLCREDRSSELEDIFGTGGSEKKQKRKEKYSKGMTVEHPRFGKGKIMKIQDSAGSTKLTVKFFGAGHRKLVAEYANLKKLNVNN